MLQRVMIAGALTSAPKLLICDEPTTALDVTTQAEIIEVLREQRAARGMGMLFITHDLNLAASICDRVVVMAGGQVDIEEGSARDIFTNPTADYTKRLIAATPSVTVTDPAPVDLAAADPAAPYPAPAGAAAAADPTAGAAPAAPAAPASAEPLMLHAPAFEDVPPRAATRPSMRSGVRRLRSRGAEPSGL